MNEDKIAVMKFLIDKYETLNEIKEGNNVTITDLKKDIKLHEVVLLDMLYKNYKKGDIKNDKRK